MKKNNRKELKQRKKEWSRPISLYPLKTEEALENILKVNPKKENNEKAAL
jgi:hypothetical protein